MTTRSKPVTPLLLYGLALLIVLGAIYTYKDVEREAQEGTDSKLRAMSADIVRLGTDVKKSADSLEGLDRSLKNQTDLLSETVSSLSKQMAEFSSEQRRHETKLKDIELINGRVLGLERSLRHVERDLDKPRPVKIVDKVEVDIVSMPLKAPVGKGKKALLEKAGVK